MMVKGRDSLWRIVDFKLPLLNRKNVTRGGHRRRRFIDSIAEGISQLYNYHDYFTHEDNVTAAVARLGERVRDPSLTLVVGTSENVDAEEVGQALRAYKAVDIIDYDTLVKLYRSGSGPGAP